MVGNIDFNQDLLVQVFTPYPGRIIEAYPNVGDKVEKGELLFTIDSPDLLTAENNLISAAGVLKLQDVTLSRAKRLANIGAGSQQALDQAKSDQMTAEGALKSARDAVRIFGKTQTEIDEIVAARKADPKLVVRSSITGYVTARTAAPGLFVQPGNAPAPFTVADLSTMWMFANVPDRETANLRVGQRVTAHVAAYPDREFVGRITVVTPAVDSTSQRVFVRSEIANPEGLLRAGMFADFTIVKGQTLDHIGVPASAVLLEGDGANVVWTQTGELRFTRKIVEIGRQQRGFVEILSGLNKGEKIVVGGAPELNAMLAKRSTQRTAAEEHR